MATRHGFAIAIQPNTPKELLALFDDHRTQHFGVEFLFSNLAEQDGYFLNLELLSSKEAKDLPWKVSIPLQYVLAIVDESDPHAPIRFK
jgi:hypothetical protein